MWYFYIIFYNLMWLNKKWFTLVEMLIVIVIIGILAAALIPRLTGVQGRARDVARKASIQQIWSAFATYNLDKSSYPSAWGTYWTWLDKLVWALTPAYMKSLPKDPGGVDTNIYNGTTPTSGWNFLYVKLAQWYVVLALNEWGWVGANRATLSGSTTISGWALTATTQYNSVKACDQVTQWTIGDMSAGGSCTANLTNFEWRYMGYAD